MADAGLGRFCGEQENGLEDFQPILFVALELSARLATSATTAMGSTASTATAVEAAASTTAAVEAAASAAMEASASAAHAGMRSAASHVAMEAAVTAVVGSTCGGAGETPVLAARIVLAGGGVAAGRLLCVAP